MARLSLTALERSNMSRIADSDTLGTVLNAAGDHTAGEPRHTRRMPVMATPDVARLAA